MKCVVQRANLRSCESGDFCCCWKDSLEAVELLGKQRDEHADGHG